MAEEPLAMWRVLVVEDESTKRVIEVIEDKSRTGFIGDGKIFISPVEEAYTIRTGEVGL